MFGSIAYFPNHLNLPFLVTKYFGQKYFNLSFYTGSPTSVALYAFIMTCAVRYKCVSYTIPKSLNTCDRQTGIHTYFTLLSAAKQ